MKKNQKNKTKVSFVIQRYGEDIGGGAESFCKQVAEHIKDDIDLEILTTCARSHEYWENEYDEGEDEINGVKVKRFKVDQKRDNKLQTELHNKLVSDPRDIIAGVDWMKAQGPMSSGLFDYISKNEKNYDVLGFFTYLYAHSFFGIQMFPQKSILVPFAHDEPYIRLHIFRKTFQIPNKIIFQAPEERDLVQTIFSNRHIEHDVIGMGIEVPKSLKVNAEKFKKENQLDKYLLYVGRIEPGKGCDELFDYFIQYKKENPSDLTLVLMGKSLMDIPERDDIKYLGFVSEEDKYSGMKGAVALVNNSKFESFSIVLLESYLSKRPVLVNAGSAVMKGHVARSGGGFVYKDQNNFINKLEILLSGKDEILGKKGYDYVKENYDWDVIRKKWKNILSS